MNIYILLPVVIYFSGMIIIGVYSSKSSNTREGFHLAGRSLGSFVTALSYAFSAMSAWVLVGYVGSVYALGPAVFYILIGFNVGFMFSFMVLGQRTRNYSQQLDAITYTDFFVKRVRDDTNFIRVVGSFSILIFMSAAVAGQFAAGAKVVSTIFKINPNLAIVMGAIVVIIYCMAGGMKAVAITDFVQGLLVVSGVLFMGFFLIYKMGGWGDVIQQASAIGPHMISAGINKTGWGLVGAILGYVGFGVGLIGRPHDTIRFFSIKSSSEIRKALVLCVGSLTFTYWGAFLIGYIGRIQISEIADVELLFPTILLNNFNPIFVGIMLSVFFGLLMSTADSMLLIAASTFTEDIYGFFKKGNISEKEMVKISRITIVAIGLLAMLIAVTSPQSVFWLVLYAGAGLSSTFGPILIYSLYWKKLTKWGAISGMVCGFVTVVLWYAFNLGSILNPALPGFILNLVVAYLVSLITKQPYEEEIEAELIEAAKVKS